LFLLLFRRPPRSPLFPYTTLFRSSLFPWVIFPAGSLPGLAGPGLWTLSAGFIAIAGALLPYRKIALGHVLLAGLGVGVIVGWQLDRKSTCLNSSHVKISYAVFCLK